MNCIIRGCDERAVVQLGCCVVHAEHLEDFRQKAIVEKLR